MSENNLRNSVLTSSPLIRSSLCKTRCEDRRWPYSATGLNWRAMLGVRSGQADQMSSWSWAFSW